MKKLFSIVVLSFLWNAQAFARVRICHGGNSCDNLTLIGAFIALGCGGFFLYVFFDGLKKDYKDLSNLISGLVMVLIGIILFSQ